MKNVIKIAVASFAFAVVVAMPKNASAQQVTQTVYNSVTVAAIAVTSSTAVQLDSTQKADRRMVRIQNIGIVDAWCSSSSAVAVNSGFLVAGSTSSYAGVPNVLTLPYSSALKVYCKAATTGSTTVFITQER